MLIPRLGRLVFALAVVGGLVATTTATPAVVRAHGPAPAEPPDAANLLLGWNIEPLVALPMLAAAWVWWSLVRRVNREHPANPVPRYRTAAFFGGLAAIAVALMSGIERYDTTLFWVHMVQHILLTFVAAPLLVLSGPITLLLRASSKATRRRWILPVLHSRMVRFVSFPVVAWVIFAAVMWGSHFSPLFDAALEDPLIHDLEHGLFLGSALLFWWPALGTDPAPWRMSPPVRALYVFLQMPQNTFLSVAILGASAPLYAHYATLDLPYGPDPLLDQQIAAGIMWLLGDLAFLGVVLALVALWMRQDARDTERADRRADAARAALREREARLAERLSREEGR